MPTQNLAIFIKLCHVDRNHNEESYVSMNEKVVRSNKQHNINKVKPKQSYEVKNVIKFVRRAFIEEKPLISYKEMEFATIIFKKMEK